MMERWPDSLPIRHRSFLTSAIEILQQERRLVGVGVGGSFLTDSMDEFSDLDIVLAVDPDCYQDLMVDRHRIADSLGPLLAGFTGEHVGEKRLLICLYDGVPILHVDLKFVSLPEVSQRIEDPFVLWDRDGRFAEALSRGVAQYSRPDLQWVEDRFWTWIHYGATKIGRGEIFEALDGLSFLRSNVLGPLALYHSGVQPTGVRRFERLASDHVRELQETVARYDSTDCVRALRACIEIYRSFRAKTENVLISRAAEAAAVRYLSDIEQRCCLTRGCT